MTDEDQNKLPTAQKHSSIPRRSLFGNERSEDTDEWLRDLEKRNLEEKVQKWNFDFREGKPLKQNELGSKQGLEQNLPSPSHVYEAVDANEVPAFYRSKTTLRTTDMDDKMKLSTPPTTPISKSRKRKLEEKATEEEEPQQDLSIVLRREKANWLSPSGKEARQQQKEQARGKNWDQDQGGTPKKIIKKEEGAKMEKKNSQQ